MRPTKVVGILILFSVMLHSQRSSAQHETRFWLNVNAGWSSLPDTDLGGIQFTLNPNRMLYSIEIMFDESLVSTGINTDIFTFHVGYVLNDPGSKVIYFAQAGPSIVKQYTTDCMSCNRYDEKKSGGVEGEMGMSYRPWVNFPFGLGARAIFNLNGTEHFAAFLINFCVVKH